MSRDGTKNMCAVSVQRGVDSNSNWVTFSCEAGGFACECKFSLGYMDPLPPGEACHYADGCECQSHAARLDALDKVRHIIGSEKKRLEDEIENA